MSDRIGSDREQKLDNLLRAYRSACTPPEASPEFMPKLWERIESGRNWSPMLWRWTRGFAAAAIAASLLLVVLQTVPGRNSRQLSSTYVEVLAAENYSDTSVQDANAALTSYSPDSPSQEPARK
jgi:hypothetical protein